VRTVYVYGRNYFYKSNNVYAINEDREFLKSELLACLKENKPVVIEIGRARLHPEDVYVKKIGREVALKNIKPVSFEVDDFFVFKEDGKIKTTITLKNKNMELTLRFTDFSCIRYEII
jgi:hypothetical protein